MMRRSTSESTTAAAAERLDEADSPVEGLDAGTLSIHTHLRRKTGKTPPPTVRRRSPFANTKLSPDIWKRPTPRFHKTGQPDDGGAPWITFEIPFARVLPHPDLASTTADASAAATTATAPSAKRYVVYDLHVRQDGHAPDGFDLEPASIERRYTHFLRLYEALRRDHPRLMQPVAFPKKVLIGNFSGALIAERSAAFEAFLDHVMGQPQLRDSGAFVRFLQDDEVLRACRLLDERRHELAVPLLVNGFRLLNRVYTDKAPCVLLLLCRLVAACTTSPLPHREAARWAELALRRYESVSDADLLVLYVPLLQTCLHLWWQRGSDNAPLVARMQRMREQGVNTRATVTLTQAIHAMDPRTETM